MTKFEVSNKIKLLINELNNKQIERKEVISMLIITFFAKKNMFLLGEPGVSKTGILEIFSTILKDGKVFDWTIKDDTTFEELFGDRYRDPNGKMIYDTTDSIVDSHITILDEVWKGNSKILNSLLSAMSNYRVVEIRGKGRIKIPNISTFGASNELPTDISLKALKDRFNVMMKVIAIEDDENWIKFISHDYDRNNQLKNTFSIEDVNFIYNNAQKVTINEAIYKLILKIKNTIKSIKIKCSDRRFDGATDILKVSAYLNGRDSVQLIDLFLLRNMIWEIETDIPKINSLIDEIIFGNEENFLIQLKQNILNYNNLISVQEGQYNDFIKFRESFENNSDTFVNSINILTKHLENLSISYKSFNSLNRHFNYTKDIEREIEKHIFLQNFKSKIYDNDKQLDDIVNGYMRKLEDNISNLKNWLDSYSMVYIYNEMVRNKNKKSS